MDGASEDLFKIKREKINISLINIYPVYIVLSSESTYLHCICMQCK
jgi:hypothetical protein